jgi:hypothetical protein
MWESPARKSRMAEAPELRSLVLKTKNTMLDSATPSAHRNILQLAQFVGKSVKMETGIVGHCAPNPPMCALLL